MVTSMVTLVASMINMVTSVINMVTSIITWLPVPSLWSPVLSQGLFALSIRIVNMTSEGISLLLWCPNSLLTEYYVAVLLRWWGAQGNCVETYLRGAGDLLQVTCFLSGWQEEGFPPVLHGLRCRPLGYPQQTEGLGISATIF